MLPRFSGERLDLIVDYLTYVAVPAYALTEAQLLPEPARLPAAAAILLSSLFHVADLESKTEEGYFVGFPAIWNIVLLYLFALGLPPDVALAVVALFVVATFVPVLAVHPFRVARLRLAHLPRHRALGGRRRRCGGQSLSVAPLGASTSHCDRALSRRPWPLPLACLKHHIRS